MNRLCYYQNHQGPKVNTDCVHPPSCTANKPVLTVVSNTTWSDWGAYLRDVCAAQGRFGTIALRKPGNLAAMRNIPAIPRDPCPTNYTAWPIPGPVFPPVNWRSNMIQYQTWTSFNIGTDILPNTSIYVLHPDSTSAATTAAMKAQGLFPWCYTG
jgi:hypothetical protein